MNLPAAKDLRDQCSAVSLVPDVSAPGHHAGGRVDERDRSGSGGEFDKTLALADLDCQAGTLRGKFGVEGFDEGFDGGFNVHTLHIVEKYYFGKVIIQLFSTPSKPWRRGGPRRVLQNPPEPRPRRWLAKNPHRGAGWIDEDGVPHWGVDEE